MASRSSNAMDCPSLGSTFQDEQRSIHRHGALISAPHTKPGNPGAKQRVCVSDFIYFDNPAPAQGHFAVFVTVNDNNLANSFWAALNSDRQIIRGPALLIIRGEAIRGTHGGCLSLVTICQWDKGHCYGELTGNFNNNNYSYYWRHKQFVPGMTIAKLYNSMPYK